MKPNHMMPVFCQRDRKYGWWGVYSRTGMRVAVLYGANEWSVLLLGRGMLPVTGKRRNLLRRLERFLGGNVKWEDVDNET